MKVDTTIEQKKVKKVYDDWKKFKTSFEYLPAKVRRELGELIEAENTGEKPPGRVIEGAFIEWLEGGRA